MHRLRRCAGLRRRAHSRRSVRLPGICLGSRSDLKATYFRARGGLDLLSRSPSGKPTHGMTIDQASTQRIRYTRSSSGKRLDELINLEDLRARHFAFDSQLPGMRSQSAGVCCGITLVGAELIEVIVVGDGVVRGVLCP